jgi:hypothetical protein
MAPGFPLDVVDVRDHRIEEALALAHAASEGTTE